jgi:hypothetical protein
LEKKEIGSNLMHLEKNITDLDTISYKELRELCKRKGLSPNGKKEKLAKILRDENDICVNENNKFNRNKTENEIEIENSTDEIDIYDSEEEEEKEIIDLIRNKKEEENKRKNRCNNKDIHNIIKNTQIILFRLRQIRLCARNKFIWLTDFKKNKIDSSQYEKKIREWRNYKKFEIESTIKDIKISDSNKTQDENSEHTIDSNSCDNINKFHF